MFENFSETLSSNWVIWLVVAVIVIVLIIYLVPGCSGNTGTSGGTCGNGLCGKGNSSGNSTNGCCGQNASNEYVADGTNTRWSSGYADNLMAPFRTRFGKNEKATGSDTKKEDSHEEKKSDDTKNH